MKRIRHILLYSITFIILLVGVIFYEIKTSEPQTNLYCQISVPFCGTKPLELTDSQYEGKEIFNSNCAACHKLDARSTGPALRNIDSIIFTKWMIDKNHKIDSIKIENLGIDYHRTMFKEVINKKNLPLLVDYCSRTDD
ncbi:cytochrome c551/c552 [Flavobacterium sp. HSC-32F16]|nr:cytochrome c [Flavobacterium sp. HSC-32F16]MCP2026235.1 cytochrome c551/c552 [Flavobacterium sp. HSC-32F16]